MTELTLSVAGRIVCSALVQRPADAHSLLVLAHGAGAGMQHPFLQALSNELEARGVATLRYMFPYMEEGRRRPDPPHVLHAAVRAAVNAAGLIAEGIPIFAGGKSLGGRMTSQAHADRPLPGVRGLVFVGFPLHPVGEPGTTRGDHLSRIGDSMLFLQGTRDRLALPELLKTVLARLGDRAHVEWLEEGDHDFKVPARAGMSRDETISWVADGIHRWVTAEED